MNSRRLTDDQLIFQGLIDMQKIFVNESLERLTDHQMTVSKQMADSPATYQAQFDKRPLLFIQKTELSTFLRFTLHQSLFTTIQIKKNHYKTFFFFFFSFFHNKHSYFLSFFTSINFSTALVSTKQKQSKWSLSSIPKGGGINLLTLVDNWFQ